MPTDKLAAETLTLAIVGATQKILPGEPLIQALAYLVSIQIKGARIPLSFSLRVGSFGSPQIEQALRHLTADGYLEPGARCKLTPSGRRCLRILEPPTAAIVKEIAELTCATVGLATEDLYALIRAAVTLAKGRNKNSDPVTQRVCAGLKPFIKKNISLS